MLTATSKAMKYLLFIFNFIFVLTGISLITIGIIIKSNNAEFKDVLNEEYLSAPNLLIFIGCFVFFVSFFGCCGAIRENHLMIFIFSVIMAAIFVAEIVIGVTGYVLKAETTDMLTTTLSQSMVKYNTSEEFTEFWDNLQGELTCCGAKNYTDWLPILGGLPMTCCTKQMGTVGVYSCNINSPSLFKTPCIDALGDIIEGNASTIGFTGIAIAVIQLLGVIFSCKLASSIRHDYESV